MEWDEVGAFAAWKENLSRVSLLVQNHQSANVKRFARHQRKKPEKLAPVPSPVLNSKPGFSSRRWRDSAKLVSRTRGQFLADRISTLVQEGGKMVQNW